MMSTSTTALFFASLAFLAIAAKARTFSSDESWHNKISIFIEYGRALSTPPLSPKSEPPSKQITNNFGKDVVKATNYERTRMSPPPSPKQSPPESQLQKARVLSPPPAPASSKPPTQSENTASPCVTGNPCSSSSPLITMVTDQDYGRTEKTHPPSPKASPPTHYDK